MKIAILIPSRNRSRLLSAAITALHEMESGENEVEYRIGADDDDYETTDVWDELRHKINVKCRIADETTATIGTIWNQLAEENADIYSCMIDDAFPITPHWDKAMSAMAKQYDAFSWYEVSAPWNVGYPTCTKKWLDRVGYIVPKHFPFWFCDTWFSEMVQFITGQGIPVSTNMALYSKQENTQSFRELDFWWGFFHATRVIRVKEAFKIVGGDFDQFMDSRKLFIRAGETRDAEFHGERIAQLENAKAVKGEPSQKYLLAKKKAEEYLEKNGLKIWQ